MFAGGGEAGEGFEDLEVQLDGGVAELVGVEELEGVEGDICGEGDLDFGSDILSWSRSRGLFAGVSLDGATLRQDEEADRALYGHDVNSKDALMGNMKDTLSNDTFTQTLTQYGGERRMQ
jgi:hypothetical protein